MPFNSLNGDFDSSDDRNQARVYNAIFEQLIRIRAEVESMHGCVQLLATKQGIPVEMMQNLRKEIFAKSYAQAEAAVLEMIRPSGEDPPQTPPRSV